MNSWMVPLTRIACGDPTSPRERGEVHRVRGTLIRQGSLAPTSLLRDVLVRLDKRASALVQRAERLLAGHGLDDLGVVPRPLRVLRLLDLEQVHVAQHAAVDPQM